MKNFSNNNDNNNLYMINKAHLTSSYRSLILDFINDTCGPVSVRIIQRMMDVGLYSNENICFVNNNNGKDNTEYSKINAVTLFDIAEYLQRKETFCEASLLPLSGVKKKDEVNDKEIYRKSNVKKSPSYTVSDKEIKNSMALLIQHDFISSSSVVDSITNESEEIISTVKTYYRLKFGSILLSLMQPMFVRHVRRVYRNFNCLNSDNENNCNKKDVLPLPGDDDISDIIISTLSKYGSLEMKILEKEVAKLLMTKIISIMDLNINKNISLTDADCTGNVSTSAAIKNEIDESIRKIVEDMHKRQYLVLAFSNNGLNNIYNEGENNPENNRNYYGIDKNVDNNEYSRKKRSRIENKEDNFFSKFSSNSNHLLKIGYFSLLCDMRKDAILSFLNERYDVITVKILKTVLCLDKSSLSSPNDEISCYSNNINNLIDNVNTCFYDSQGFPLLPMYSSPVPLDRILPRFMGKNPLQQQCPSNTKNAQNYEKEKKSNDLEIWNNFEKKEKIHMKERAFKKCPKVAVLFPSDNGDKKNNISPLFTIPNTIIYAKLLEISSNAVNLNNFKNINFNDIKDAKNSILLKITIEKQIQFGYFDFPQKGTCGIDSCDGQDSSFPRHLYFCFNFEYCCSKMMAMNVCEKVSLSRHGVIGVRILRLLLSRNLENQKGKKTGDLLYNNNICNNNNYCLNTNLMEDKAIAEAVIATITQVRTALLGMLYDGYVLQIESSSGSNVNNSDALLTSSGNGKREKINNIINKTNNNNKINSNFSSSTGFFGNYNNVSFAWVVCPENIIKCVKVQLLFAMQNIRMRLLHYEIPVSDGIANNVHNNVILSNKKNIYERKNVIVEDNYNINNDKLNIKTLSLITKSRFNCRTLQTTLFAMMETFLLLEFY